MNRRGFLRAALAGTAAAVSSTRARATGQSAEFDVVIIGAGSAGCVVAERLSRDPALRVLVIEAGSAPAGDPSIATPGRWVSLLGSRYDWNYATAASPGLDGRALRWPRGRVVGGSSAINAMAYVRGHRASFAAWADAAGPQWGYDALLPVFRQLEDNSRGASASHGAGGLLPVADTTDPHAGHLAFLEAAAALGYGASPTWDFNGATQENGAGFYQKTIRDGRRVSAADAFLLPALSRSNLTLWSDARVQRLAVDKGRVRAVVVARGGSTVRVPVAREVVLCAGVIESPRLLMLSGIGPAAHLRAHGLPVVVDAPDVGRHLHDHPRVSLRWRARRPLPPSSVSAGLFVYSSDRGPSAAGRTAPDLQFYVGRGADTPDEFITLTVALSVPRSRGRVTLASADPGAAPIIDAGYFRAAEDLDALAAGVQLAQRLAAAPVYGALRGDPIDPPGALATASDREAFIRRAADTIYHPVGTCRMGRDAQSVVDPSLKVRGLEGLRVADGSVMPVSVNSQTHAACVVIGDRAADAILQRGSSQV